MLPRRHSLLAGRNPAPLSENQIITAGNVFLGMQPRMQARVNTVYDPAATTAFRLSIDNRGQQFGEIVFGPDIYPGPGVVDPNSALSLDSAVAHELTHYHRWRNATALNEIDLLHIDEAQTSLEAILRYEDHLELNDTRQLVHDALQRIQLYVTQIRQQAPPAD